jgi:alpha-tubulin suppressor-like RCC1 family protein
MALRPDGRVVCWGRNYHGDCLGTDASGNAISGTPDGSQTVRVLGAELQGVVQIAAGYEHATAIRQNGTVACWGRNDYGQRVVPANLPAAQQIDGGAFHTIILARNGRVYCWGDNSYGQSAGTLAGGAPDLSSGTGLRAVKINGVPLRRVEAIASGAGYHSVALLREGQVVAWGGANPSNPYASHGQANVPDSVQGRALAIDGGYINTLVLVEAPESDDEDEGESECDNGLHVRTGE